MAHPLANASRTPLEQALQRFPVRVPLPSVDVFGNQPSAVWANADFSNIALAYSDQSIVVEYSYPVSYPDPAANYRSYVAETADGSASLTEIGPHPALVMQAGSSRLRSVEFVRDRIRIVVVGLTPLTDLIAVAGSISSAS
jgi:hypothetical protein